MAEIARHLGVCTSDIVKLPAHRAGLPGKEISFLFVPLDPAYKAGLAGHYPVKGNIGPYLTRKLHRKPLFGVDEPSRLRGKSV